MTIADLFVKLSVAGAEGVTRTLSGVQKGLGSVLDSSLATKAGILAVIAGLERLTGFASQTGMELNKFAMTTGLSTDMLQNWQYMGQKFDVGAQEMSNTISGLQSTVTDMMLGKGMPEGAAALGIKMTRDPYELMTQLTKKAKELPPDVARNLIKSFGISDNVFQMMRSVNLEMDKIKKKDLISPNEIKKLTDINKAWKDMWFTLKTMGVKLVAKDGLAAVEELANAFHLFMDAAKWVIGLTEQFKPLKYILLAIAGVVAFMFSPFTAAIAAATALIALLSDIQKFREGKSSVIGSVVDTVKDIRSNPKAAVSRIGESISTGASDLWSKLTGSGPASGVPKAGAETVAPKVSGATGAVNQGDVNMTNTFHIDGSDDPKQTGSEIQKHIGNAVWQSKALTRVN